MRRLIIVLLLVLCAAAVPAASAGAEDMEVSALLKDMEAIMEWNPLREIGVIVAGGDRIVFKLGFPMMIVDYSERIDVDPPVRRDGAIWFTQGTVSAMREALLRCRLQRRGEQFRISMIVIDPGHGGRDPGTVDEITINGKKTPIYEKTIDLTVSKMLADELSSAYADKKIVMTRSTDVYLSPEQRAEMANAWLNKTSDSILYISIHANRSETRPTAAGFEIWILPPEEKRTLLNKEDAGSEYSDILPILNSMMEEDISVWSQILADDILKGLEDKVGSRTPNRGLKKESWAVVRNSKMPAVLLEVGFISNPAEAARLLDPVYLKDLVEGIYTGIRSFITSVEDTGS